MRHSKKSVPAEEQPAAVVPAAEERPAEAVPETENGAGEAGAYCAESEGADTACGCGGRGDDGNAVEFSSASDAGTSAGDAAEASAGTPENAETAKLAEDFAKAQAELLKTKEAYLRAVAEFDNYRRRCNEEKPKLANYAKGDLAKDIFPILDNFKLGLDAAAKQHPDDKSFVEGFAMIAAQLKNALAQHNIVEIDPAGQAFDPNEHESLTSQPSDDVPEDHVLFVHRVGYKIGDRLLRPASVVISSGKQS